MFRAVAAATRRQNVTPARIALVDAALCTGYTPSGSQPSLQYLKATPCTHRRLKSTQLTMETAATDKGKRVSTQVHRMLLKAKAVGDKKLRIEDRYFLEVHYW